MKLKLIFSFFILVFLFNSVSAKFVCGVLEDSDDGRAGSWFNVNVYYLSGEKGNCKVSPSDGKYCCDLDSIKSEWKVGDVVYAESFSRNYYARPVNLTVTESSYDVFPTMKLEKVISLYSPSKKIYIGNYTELLFNLSFLSPYTEVYIDNERIDLNNSIYEKNLSVIFGANDFNVIAKGNGKSFYEDISFGVIENYNASIEFFCVDCSSKKIRENSLLKVKVGVNFSNDLENVVLYSYVPSDWEIVNSSGNVKRMSYDFNAIAYNFSGFDFEEEYYVLAPNISEKYNFAFMVEDETLTEEDILVYKYVPVNSHGGSKKPNKYVPNKTQEISPGAPLVDNKDENFKLAIYPNNFTLAGGELKPYEFNFNSSFKVIRSYLIESTLGLNEMEKISLEFKINKSEIKNESKLKFVGLQDKKWVPLTGKVVHEDEDSISFSYSGSPITGFAVLEERNSTFISNIFYKIKLWFKRIF